MDNEVKMEAAAAAKGNLPEAQEGIGRNRKVSEETGRCRRAPE